MCIKKTITIDSLPHLIYLIACCDTAICCDYVRGELCHFSIICVELAILVIVSELVCVWIIDHECEQKYSCECSLKLYTSAKVHLSYIQMSQVFIHICRISYILIFHLKFIIFCDGKMQLWALRNLNVMFHELARL